MKKVTALVMILLVLTTFCGCGFKSSSSSMKTTAEDNRSVDSSTTSIQDKTEAASKDTGSSTSGNILVVYFSRAGENYGVGTVDKGNTAIVADMIAEKMNADIFEIVPVNAYPEKYDDTLKVVQQEISEKALPNYQNDVEKWNTYDTIFIGYPIWYGDMPRIVYTFLESHDWTGKTVIPFDTNGGSGLADTKNTIASETGTTVLEGLAVSGTDAQNNKDSVRNAVQVWLEKLGY